jgi:alpha-glucoside transport system permease protein
MADVPSQERPIPTGQQADQPITIDGVTKSFQEWRAGVTMPDGSTLRWEGTVRVGKLVKTERRLTANLNFTLANYSEVIGGQEVELRDATGKVTVVKGEDLVASFINSLTVTIPSTIIPILIAAFAAYGFAWMRFPGRRLLFIVIVALLVVPLQIALVPILRDYVSLKLNGTFLGVWLAHAGFGLPLATYLLYNYISTLPRDLLESAFIDGASHFTMFIRLILPLLLTMRIAGLVGSRGQDWHLLTAGAFVSMIVPLLVFFALQRYFVRGLMAGSVKG